jgi:hypothetical protein
MQPVTRPESDLVIIVYNYEEEEPGSSLLCLSGNSTFLGPKMAISLSGIALFRLAELVLNRYPYPCIALLKLKLLICRQKCSMPTTIIR